MDAFFIRRARVAKYIARPPADLHRYLASLESYSFKHAENIISDAEMLRGDGITREMLSENMRHDEI